MESIIDTIQTGQIEEPMQYIDVESKIDINNFKQSIKHEYRKVTVPANRMKPLKENWTTIVKALVEHMKVQVKMNTKMKCVELRTYEETEDVSSIQKCEEFLKAFMCGFDLEDAIAMLRLEDLYLETFEIKDGKTYI